MITNNDLIKAIDHIDLAVSQEINVNSEIGLWESEAAARSKGQKNTICLNYGNQYRVDRVINYPDGKEKKATYPKHYLDGKWIGKLPENRNLFPLYQEYYLDYAKDKLYLHKLF